MDPSPPLRMGTRRSMLKKGSTVHGASALWTSLPLKVTLARSLSEEFFLFVTYSVKPLPLDSLMCKCFCLALSRAVSSPPLLFV